VAGNRQIFRAFFLPASAGLLRVIGLASGFGIGVDLEPAVERLTSGFSCGSTVGSVPPLAIRTDFAPKRFEGLGLLGHSANLSAAAKAASMRLFAAQETVPALWDVWTSRDRPRP
jgi:hypothetical protein